MRARFNKYPLSPTLRLAVSVLLSRQHTAVMPSYPSSHAFFPDPSLRLESEVCRVLGNNRNDIPEQMIFLNSLLIYSYDVVPNMHARSANMHVHKSIVGLSGVQYHSPCHPLCLQLLSHGHYSAAMSGVHAPFRAVPSVSAFAPNPYVLLVHAAWIYVLLHYCIRVGIFITTLCVQLRIPNMYLQATHMPLSSTQATRYCTRAGIADHWRPYTGRDSDQMLPAARQRRPGVYGRPCTVISQPRF